MKLILSLIVVTFISCSSFAQITNVTNNMSPKERASWWMKFYADALSLDKNQQKQVYSVLLDQQKKLKDISSAKIVADKETLRNVYFGVDDDLKNIFNQSQYMQYLSLQSHAFFTYRSEAKKK
jgi:hypothetical protein